MLLGCPVQSIYGAEKACVKGIQSKGSKGKVKGSKGKGKGSKAALLSGNSPWSEIPRHQQQPCPVASAGQTPQPDH